MKCPYCFSEIADEALACPHCTRDLYLFMPLLARLQQLERGVDSLKNQQITLAGQNRIEVGTEDLVEPVIWPTWLLLLLALLLLLLAHGVITMILDLPTIWLRVTSMVIPLPFGILLLRSTDSHIGPRVLGVAAVSFLAVIGMSAVVAVADGSPVLPADIRERREFLSYAASIFLSFVTGMVVSRHIYSGHRNSSYLLRKIDAAIWGVASDPKKAQAQLDALRNLITALTTTVVAAASLVSGLIGVLRP